MFKNSRHILKFEHFLKILNIEFSDCRRMEETVSEVEGGVLRLRGCEKEVSYLLPLLCDWLSTVQVRVFDSVEYC